MQYMTTGDIDNKPSTRSLDADTREMELVVGGKEQRTKLRAAPLVFFSPPSSKLERSVSDLDHDEERAHALLAALERHLHFVFARGALQAQHDLLSRLRLYTARRVRHRSQS
jgi:hypothetical protein